MTSPTMIVSERYEPRVCAAVACTQPPVVTYLVTVDCTLYGRDWRAGQRLTLCATHDLTPTAGVGWHVRPPAGAAAGGAVTGRERYLS